MYRKNLISKIGKYPKEFLYAQDYAFYLKVLKNYQIYISDENLLKSECIVIQKVSDYQKLK